MPAGKPRGQNQLPVRSQVSCRTPGMSQSSSASDGSAYLWWGWGLPVVFSLSLFFFTFPIHATLSMPHLFVLKLMFHFFFLGSGEITNFFDNHKSCGRFRDKRSRSARAITTKRSAAIIADQHTASLLQRHRCSWKWRMWSVCFYSITILELLGWNRILEQEDGLPRGASSFKEGN